MSITTLIRNYPYRCLLILLAGWLFPGAMLIASSLTPPGTPWRLSGMVLAALFFLFTFVAYQAGREEVMSAGKKG